MRRGSITIYLSLTLFVMIALITGSITSVKVQAGRMETANSTDQALYSLFARYDRDLYEEFGLFFLSAQNGSGMDMEMVCEAVTDAMTYILEPNRGRELLGGKNLLDLEVTEHAVTGYVLATDEDGDIFAEQAVDYMKDTLGVQGIALLRERVETHTDTTKEQDKNGRELEADASQTSYEELQEKSSEAAASAAEEDAVLPEAGEEEKEAAGILDTVEQIRKMSLLDLVVPDAGSISAKTADRGSFLSGRTKEQGFGVIETADTGVIDSFLFQEYLIQNLSDWRSPETNAALSYQLEYIIGGKSSDRDNLETVVNRLIAIRTAADLLAIYEDPTLNSELTAIAASASAALFIPEAVSLVKLVLAAGWAFCEAAMDVRTLLSGKRIALVKTYASWQVHLKDIPKLISSPDSLMTNTSGGMSYEDYLRVLLALADRNTKQLRALDMVECTIRGLGRSEFRMDNCLCALGMELKVTSEHRHTFTTEQTIDYRSL